jgi:hypothetical protein
MPTNPWYNRVNASALGDDARELSALLPTVGVSGWERKKVLNEFKKCGGEYS